MAEIGDVVRVPWHRDGARWVVAGKSGGPTGRNARLVRRAGGERGWIGLTVGEHDPEVVETPIFTSGQRVKCDGRPGQVIAIEPAQIPGEARIRVRLDPYRWPLRGGGYFRRDNDEIS